MNDDHIDDHIRERTEAARIRSRERSVHQAKGSADYEFAGLNPRHKARAWRDLETYAGEKAAAQEHDNEENGVPE